MLCLVVVTAFLTGCATSPALQQSTYQLPQRVELESVPFYPQEKYQCGPAALATALNYAPGETATSPLPASQADDSAWVAAPAPGSVRATGVTADDLVSQVFIPGRDGSVQPEMLASARRQKRLAFPVRPTFDALLTHVADGYPVVVLQNLSLQAFPMWHYAVVVGYDMPAEQLVLRSGETRRQTSSFARFDATWARSERWGFVLADPGHIPAGITPKRAVDAISDYEALHGPAAALSSWQALVTTQPDNAMGYFALGNTYYALNQKHKAKQAFRRATVVDDTLGVAWLNLGLLHQSHEKTDKAREALQKAAALPGPWQGKARTALDTL